ncbi:MAG: hypothetical protein WBO16_20505 [Gammaproteobacteria bacterium]
MHAQSYSNPPGYLFIMIGLLLSIISALVPHFEAGHTLLISVFAAGMLPYVVYGVAVPLLRGTLTTAVGLMMVVAHTWLVLNQRIIGNADYSDGWIYYVPMLIALAVFPIAIVAIKKQGIF